MMTSTLINSFSNRDERASTARAYAARYVRLDTFRAARRERRRVRIARLTGAARRIRVQGHTTSWEGTEPCQA